MPGDITNDPSKITSFTQKRLEKEQTNQEGNKGLTLENATEIRRQRMRDQAITYYPVTDKTFEKADPVIQDFVKATGLVASLGKEINIDQNIVETFGKHDILVYLDYVNTTLHDLKQEKVIDPEIINHNLEHAYFWGHEKIDQSKNVKTRVPYIGGGKELVKELIPHIADDVIKPPSMAAMWIDATQLSAYINIDSFENGIIPHLENPEDNLGFAYISDSNNHFKNVIRDAQKSGFWEVERYTGKPIPYETHAQIPVKPTYKDEGVRLHDALLDVASPRIKTILKIIDEIEPFKLDHENKTIEFPLTLSKLVEPVNKKLYSKGLIKSKKEETNVQEMKHILNVVGNIFRPYRGGVRART
ncbi:MAG: hypothetical protein HRT47_01700 [Candidatus Caenarcaniphilales bacterium]|nr:hypothetical protein [Candidatus Caenarcaniphilales bacterium]